MCAGDSRAFKTQVGWNVRSTRPAFGVIRPRGQFQGEVAISSEEIRRVVVIAGPGITSVLKMTNPLTGSLMLVCPLCGATVDTAANGFVEMLHESWCCFPELIELGGLRE